MEIKQTIELLQKMEKKGETDLVIAWWEKDMFSAMTEEQWGEFCNLVDDRMDWSYTHESICGYEEAIFEEN